MENKNERARPNDYPELQIGYPERNDVKDPNGDMERIHVNFENFELKRLNAEGVTRELRSPGSLNAL